MPRKTTKGVESYILSGVEDRGQVDVRWKAMPSQEPVLLCPAFEITCGGSRGGGKSAVGLAFMIKGNQAYDFPLFDSNGEPILVNHSYVFHPHYTGLVLRRNFNDLREWIEAAKWMYGPTGGEWISAESCFRWEYGSRVVAGHLDGPDAWEKYQGHEYQRINIEELPQVEEEKRYTMLFASCRSKYPELKCQIFSSANPAGRGVSWYKSRFVKVNDFLGNRIKPTEIFYEKKLPDGRKSYVTVPCDPKKILKMHEGGVLTRTFIPMWLKDNQYLMSNAAYQAALEALPDRERRAMLDGDWDAMVEGRYFEEFREVHLTGEPDTACHVTKPVQLEPWYERWMGCDWGLAHEVCVYWSVKNEADRRVHTYREMIRSGMEPFQFGVELAQMCVDDFTHPDAQKTINLYLSHDAFHNRKGASDPTVADLIASGIRECFGPGGCLLPNYVDDDRMGAFYESGESFYPRIVIHKVDAGSGSRKLASNYIRYLLRWWEIPSAKKADFDIKKAEDMIASQGIDKYRAYVRKMQEEGEVLPKVLIWDTCPGLIEQIPQIMRDENDLEDYDTKKGKWDRYDAWRYCLYSHHARVQSKIPKDKYIDQKLRAMYGNQPIGPAQASWARQRLEAQWKREFGSKSTPLPIGRRARRGRFS